MDGAAYNFLLFLHVTSVFLFLLGHGGTAVVAFRLRRPSGVEEIRTLLGLERGLGMAAGYTGLAYFVTGVALGFLGSYWSMIWIWASIVLLFVISGTMNGLGTRYIAALRAATGLPVKTKKGVPAPPALSDAEVLALAATGKPQVLAAVGVLGLVAITWLMMYKPF